MNKISVNIYVQVFALMQLLIPSGKYLGCNAIVCLFFKEVSYKVATPF